MMCRRVSTFSSPSRHLRRSTGQRRVVDAFEDADTDFPLDRPSSSVPGDESSSFLGQVQREEQLSGSHMRLVRSDS